MLIYYNPHLDDFLAEPIQFRLLRRRPLKKYGFLFEEARINNEPINILVDGSASCLIPNFIFSIIPKFLRNIVSKIEILIWKKINGFGSEIILVPLQDKVCEDTLLVFSYKGAVGNFHNRKIIFSHYHFVVFHLSHYFVATKEKAQNLSSLDNIILAGDSDIVENEYFQKYFGWYLGPFLVLPFSVGKRFVNHIKWDDRDNRAVATGTFHDLNIESPKRLYTDFINTTGSTTYHPIRRLIFNSRDEITDLINCKVAPYRKYGVSLFKKFLAHFQVSQRAYFSIDIVGLYNNHKFAVVGEELSGFPALGALEAMACGCVVFSQEKYYGGLGLIAGLDYIHYDGTLEDLLLKISKAKLLDLENISVYISNKIEKNFNSTSVYIKWMATINSLNLHEPGY